MNKRELFGLVPAAGQAVRISPLPCSKEVYPIGFQSVSPDRSLRPKVACHYLLEKMQFARVSRAFIILRHGKWDIPGYLGDGKMLDMHLAYLTISQSSGVPFTLDQAYPFVQDGIVAFGFPDIIFQTVDAFVQLLGRQAATKADVVLGLFPTDEPQKKDMVDIKDDGRIRRIVIRPNETSLRYTWSIAVWSSQFTRFLHEYLPSLQELRNNASVRRELSVGNVVQAAIDKDLRVDGVVFSDDYCLDIGTPTDLVKAIRNLC